MPKESLPVSIVDGKLAIEGLVDRSIRVTPDGRVSVYDFIRVACGLSNPRQLWTGDKKKRKGGQKGLAERYPELVRNTDKWKFPGRGGAARPTPVINRAGLIELMQVLPGEVGAKFRREIAQIVIRYLDGDTTLADEVVDRAMRQGKVDDVKHHYARTQGILARNILTSTCKAHGVHGSGYAMVTNAVYKGLFGKNAKGLRKDLGLPEKANPRNAMSTRDLISLSFTEMASADRIEETFAYGNSECASVANKTAKEVGLFLGKGEFPRP